MSATRTAVVDGCPVLLKHCDQCGFDGIAMDTSASDFSPNSRHPDGRVRSWSSRCKRCAAKRRMKAYYARHDEVLEQRRQHYHERVETDQAYADTLRERNREAARKKRADPVKRALLLQQQREWRKRERKRDPKGIREKHRMAYALRQERVGRSVRKRPTVIDGTCPRLPAAPFRLWLQAYQREIGERPVEQLARELEIEQHRIFGTLAGGENIAQDVVDRALINAIRTVYVDGRLIVTLEDLYPSGEDDA